MHIFVYDFETTGLPLWGEPSDDERQPHIVQAAACLVDTDTRKIRNSVNLIVRPDGWEIPEEVAAIHGISTEEALRCGLPEPFVIHCLWSLWEQSRFRVGHNESFDARIMRIALKRYFGDEPFPGDAEGRTPADVWKAGQAACTARMANPIMKMAATEKMVAAGRGKSPKMPKLTEAFEHFMGRPMPNAHTALGDVKATIAVYFAIQAHLEGVEKAANPNATPDGNADPSDDEVCFLT